MINRLSKELLRAGMLLGLLMGGVRAESLVLADQGVSNYQLVIPADSPTSAIDNALKEVARLIQTAFHVNGADLPIVSEMERDSAKPSIFLGNTRFARDAGVTVAELPGWGYVHQVVGRDLILAGRDHAAPEDPSAQWDRIGTARAATDFLKNYVGVRFLYPDLLGWSSITDAKGIADWATTPAVEFLPTPLIAVPNDLKITFTPRIDWNVGYPPSGSFYDIANNRFPRVDTVFGCHTYERAAPGEKYYESHPEFFALVGENRINAGQYCVSNPDFQELLFQDMCHWLDLGFKDVDLGQPDGFRACQCEACKQLFDTGDDWSEKLWILHRNLAERILKKYPDRFVTLMSYILTAQPPKSFKKFPKNVKIMLCGTNEDDIEPWLDYEVPGGFTSYVYNWCPNLGTRYTPMRTPRYVETQVRRLAKNKIQAIQRDGPGQLYGLEGPVYYTMGRMFDDPENLEAKDIVHEFCGAAFGKSAAAMLRFYDRLYHNIELYAEYLGTRCPGWGYTDIYGRRHKHLSDPFQLLGFLYTPELLGNMEKDLTAAEKSSDAPRVKARLLLVRREFDYLVHLANVVHLYRAFQVAPEVQAIRDRLLDAIDQRNAFIETLFDLENNRATSGAQWAATFFPFGGHNASHLRLAHDGYQEPMKDSCFNWDTAAIRAAPPSDAKRLAISYTTMPVTLDSPAWEKAVDSELSPLPLETTLSQKTSFRVLYDKDALHVKVVCSLSGVPNAPLPDAESVLLFLTPESGKEISCRFATGPDSNKRTDAASGFIRDVMDPRHGQYDPDWKGEWIVETQRDAQGWTALFHIPIATLDVQVPVPETFWRMNIARIHTAESGRIERALWSSNAQTREFEDRAIFGELIFQTDSEEVRRHPMAVFRDEYNAKTGEIPTEWKALADPLPSPLQDWKFRADPLEQGLKQGWQQPDLKEEGWLPGLVPAFWSEINDVGDYQGYGWYRVRFQIPATWKGRSVRILFAGVDEEAWVYVNGMLVQEHNAVSEKKPITDLWETPFVAEVSPENLRYGEENQLAVRVRNSLANGGLWRPVRVHAAPATAP